MKLIYLIILRWIKRLLDGPSRSPRDKSSGIRFSPDGTYIAVAMPASPFVHIYRNDGSMTKFKPLEPSVEEAAFADLDREFPGYKEEE